jgi:hypothetical protein
MYVLNISFWCLIPGSIQYLLYTYSEPGSDLEAVPTANQTRKILLLS